MKIITLQFSIILLLLSFSAQAQEIYISTDYKNIPFEDFIKEVESKTAAKFFYKKEWIEDITITSEGGEQSLESILEKNLAGTNVFFSIDQEKNIVITYGTPLIFAMPEYNKNNMANNGKEIAENDKLTAAEKTYIEGRKKMGSETITIGKAQSNQSGNAIINGDIKDIENGEPLIGATIFIKELAKGFMTDVNGHFTLTVSPGKYSAQFNSLGMKELNYFLNVLSSGKISIEMEKNLLPINEVTVKADRFDNVRGTQMGFERLSIKNIKEIPLILGEKDVLKVAQMLPGIQSVGEGASGINVRGSAADQNMFYINKVPVYNTSHLFGFFSAFNPHIIRDFSIYKSNIPAKYGGKLASVFDISTRQGNKKKYTAHGGISPITGHIALEGPIKKDHSSFILSARSTYSDWLLKELNDPDLRNSSALFYDLAGNVNINTNDRNLFKFFGYHSFDKFSLASTHNYQYSNAGASVNWWHQFSPKFSSDITAIFGSYQFENVDNKILLESYKQAYKIGHYELKADFTRVHGQNNTLVFGGNMILYDLDRGNLEPAGPESLKKSVLMGKERGVEGAIHAADEFQLSSKLTLYGGIRYSFYGYLGPQSVNKYNPGSPVSEGSITDTLHFANGEIIKSYGGPEFRGSLNFRTGKNSSMKLSYSKTRQYLFMMSNTIAISPNDQWKLSDSHIKPTSADQLSLGYYKDFITKNLSFSSEIYYKNTNNIIEYKDGADLIASPHLETEILRGDQSAYGIEFMLKKNGGKLTGWISSGYSRSKILVNGVNSWEKINKGKEYPSNYDIPLSINSVFNFKVNRRLSLSSNLVYHTGRPVTYPVSVFYVENKEYVTYSSRNAYRIPDYFRVDFSINLEGNLKSRKVSHSYWMLNIYNLTGRTNAYSVFFQSEDGIIRGYKMSIFARPIMTLSWNFKFGNYASD